VKLVDHWHAFFRELETSKNFQSMKSGSCRSNYDHYSSKEVDEIRFSDESFWEKGRKMNASDQGGCPLRQTVYAILSYVGHSVAK
jgi:hypothetical protein